MQTTDEEDDRHLLRLIVARDELALADLYARHAAALFGYLLGLTSDPSQAEEILQDTWVAAWKSAKRFQGRSKVRTWLFAIARRQARDRRRRHALDLSPDVELDRLADPVDGPEDLVLAQVERAELAGLVARLAARHREVLNLAFVHELSYAEMAQVLDIPAGTVKSRLHTAKRALQVLLKGRQEVG